MPDPMETTEEVLWFGPGGTPLPDAAGAASCEIVEYVDGVSVRRTYADLDAAPVEVDVAVPDFVRESEDWTKGTWDLFGDHDDGMYREIDTRTVLFRSLGWDTMSIGEQRSAVCAFLELPVWEAAPAKLQGEVYEWLRATAPGGAAETKTLEDRRAVARDDADAKLRRWEQALEDTLAAFYARQLEALVARLRGPKARRGTRHWKDEGG